MEKNFSPVKPSDGLTDTGDEETYGPSSPDASSESDLEANELIVNPSVMPETPVIKPEPQPGPEFQPPQINYSSSDEEYSDEAEWESDVPDPKPNGSLGNPRSRPGAPDPDIPAKYTGKKRAAGGTVSVTKRSKNKPEGSGKKPGELFRRFFSEDDEIALLEGMISYGSEKKSDPFADVSAFHDFVKPNLQSSPKVDQLLLKMRKLKTKYDKNKRKEESGRARNLKAHERRAYELSKLVNWNENRKGGKSISSPKPVSKRMAAKTTRAEKMNADGNGGAVSRMTWAEKAIADASDEGAVNGDFHSLAEIMKYNHSNMDRIGARLFEGENRVEGAAEWHNLQMEEMELCKKTMELMYAKSKLVTRALKSEKYRK